MACSKLFSGDLPELTNKIIQYFWNDYKTLYSCILVNRLWCRFAIPLLWENPFSKKFPKNCDFVGIFLHFLNDEDKAQLNEYGIKSNLIPTNALFNYPKFIKCLNEFKISTSIKNWVMAICTSTTQEQNQLSMHFSNFSNLEQITKFIYKSLLKIFIENEANLHTFEFVIFSDKDNNDAFELILQNPNFICNIRNLELNFSRANDSEYSFLNFLCSNCNSISSIYCQFPSTDNTFINKYLSQIINSQQNLKKILLDNNSINLYHSLLSLKYSNCSNTLSTIIFYHVDFKNTINLKEIFEQLNVLDSIHILYCNLNSHVIQQIINITKPFKLRSLFMREESFKIENFEELLQKSGDYLENFGHAIYSNKLNKQESIELVIEYCKNIKSLDFVGFISQDIYPAFKLIENIQHSLNYLVIDILYNCYNQTNAIIELSSISSIVLLSLGQILPFKLEYLRLGLMFNTNEFEVFLNNSQNTFIKKLCIRNSLKKQGEGDILPCIKKYIMEKKRVEYLAIKEIFLYNIPYKSNELISLKNEVKEFKLHNIEVLYYDNLYINAYDFIKEID
ncbi:hypothetical protein C1645_866808 [Glomus cerebriforme]|uniref:F-box domain-containing protein n=1 Tax=Glomus cerebriforme TaxID=658196 RepID=A0A397S1Z1_9GLOM|nr:hypothetical protein C1645_866808 [Glomus cerebriforme]